MASNPSTNPSFLTGDEVLQRVFDNQNDQLRVNMGVAIDSGEMEIALDSSDDSIAIGDAAGKLATITTVGSKNGLDVNLLSGSVSGTFSPSGLSNGLESQSVVITDSPTEIPVITGQNGISIRVWGPTVVYFGGAGVTASQGYPKRQYEEIVMDVRDSAAVRIYAVCSPGQTCDVRVMAVA